MTCSVSYSVCMFSPEYLKNRLKEYRLITPISTDSEGCYLSRLLSANHKQRIRRDVSQGFQAKNYNLFFNITAFGRELHLRLRPNERLVAPGAKVEWRDEVANSENDTNTETQNQSSMRNERILKRELLKTDCTFVGDITDVPGASVAINNCDGLVGLQCTSSSFSMNVELFSLHNENGNDYSCIFGLFKTHIIVNACV